MYPIKASRDLLIGRITGPYAWSADSDLREHDYCNVREVEWLARVPRVRFSQAALRSFGSFSSVSTADDHLDEVRAVLAEPDADRVADVPPEDDGPLGVTPPLLKIQAKSGTSTIGAPAVKQLRGVLNPGEKGVLIGLGGFSSDAKHTEQNDANLILIDADRCMDLFLSSYDRLSAEMRHRLPLQQVYVVAS
ncbi:MAG: restriction endonuclease [Planctomycetota bacterium]